jgi:hypothetical protein
MKLVDKIKNLFLDELEDEDEEEEEEVAPKEKPKLFQKREKVKEQEEPQMEELPKFMRQSIKKEEPKEEVKKVEVKEDDEFEFKFNLDSPKEEVKEEKKEEIKLQPILEEAPKRNNMPIDFEKEFAPKPKPEKVNVNVLDTPLEPVKKVSELYAKKEEVTVKPKFKASPVISPVYGILDKNYTKEEVKEREEDGVLLKRPSKKVDFETVRKKAFGNLADEIKDNLLCENCELYKEVKKISSLSEDDLLYDMTVDEEKDNKEVTIEKAYDNYEEFGVAYEPKLEKRRTEIHKEENEKGLDDLIIDNNINEEKEELVLDDSKQEEDMDEVEVHDSYEGELDEVKEEKEEKEEEIPSREKKNDTKVDEDFFDLIDSMYKERVDE